MFLGACVGLAAGGLLGFPHAFQAVALPGLALGVLVIFLRVPPERTVPSSAPHLGAMLKDGMRALRIPTLKWMLPSGVLISFAAGGYTSWAVDFTVRYKGLTLEQAIEVYFFLVSSAGVLGVITAGVVADRFQRRHPAGRALTMALGFLASVPFSVYLILVDSHWTYLIAGWFLLFFLPWYNGPMAAVIDDVVDDADAGTAQATFVLFLNLLGTGPAGYVLGVISQHASLKVAFFLPVVALVVASFCAFMGSRHVARDMALRGERAARRRAMEAA
jgi:sugar phosphate permease